jgi:hypothetical protein
MAIEQVIFSNLVTNEEYGRKVIPFLKEEYFPEYENKVIFNLIEEYVKKYNSFPSKEALAIDLTDKSGVSELSKSVRVSFRISNLMRPSWIGWLIKLKSFVKKKQSIML